MWQRKKIGRRFVKQRQGKEMQRRNVENQGNERQKLGKGNEGKKRRKGMKWKG